MRQVPVASLEKAAHVLSRGEGLTVDEGGMSVCLAFGWIFGDHAE